MSVALLDTNVLLALLDPLHSHHDAAHLWFEGSRHVGWATCPITQNGYVRIASQPRYANPVEVSEAAELLRDLTSAADHRFWPDDRSLVDPEFCEAHKLSAPRHVTDTYLLGLAATRGGMLATFDRSLSTSAVRKGSALLILLR